MMEYDTNYAFLVTSMTDPTCASVRALSDRFIASLPEADRDKLFSNLKRDGNRLTSEPRLCAYTYAFGAVREARLHRAFTHLPSDFTLHDVELIDYGCGVGLGAMAYGDLLRERCLSASSVRRITLIDPSPRSLARAALHAKAFFPAAELRTVCKYTDDLCPEDVPVDSELYTLHIFSHISDLNFASVEHLADTIRPALRGCNHFVCATPFCERTMHGTPPYDLFVELMDIPETDRLEENLSAGRFVSGERWTAALRIFAKDITDGSSVRRPLSNSARPAPKSKSSSKPKQKSESKSSPPPASQAVPDPDPSHAPQPTPDPNPAPELPPSLEQKVELAPASPPDPAPETNPATEPSPFLDQKMEPVQESLEKPALETSVAIELPTEHAEDTNHQLDEILASLNDPEEPEHIRQLRQSAEDGEAKAQNKLGYLYDMGQELPQNDAEAVHWYRRAAAQDHAMALYNLANHYLSGRGVPQDTEEAILWYRRAADLGVLPAMNNLGVIYASGRGVRRNEAEAVKWYRRAAERGDETAIRNLKRRGITV